MSSRPLCVVQLVPALQSGGVERGTVELSAELTRRGHRSIVISGGGTLVPEIRSHGAEHYTWSIGEKSPATARWVWPLRQLLQREKVSILHARSRVPAWVAWLAWKSLPKSNRPRWVTTAHGLYSVNRFSAIMASGERVIAISETVQQYLRSNYPQLPAGRIRVIPRGVNVEQFPRGFQPSSAWIEKWYSAHPDLMGRPLISLVGRITRCKGHHDLVDIVDRLRASLPDIRALIVGGADPRRQGYAQEIRSEIQRRGLEKYFVWTGQRADVRELYAVSNVVLSLTSDPPEAFGRTTIEALHLGTPVVGYDHGGTGEILRNVFPEGLVPAGDVAAAADAVRRVLDFGGSIPDEHPYLQERMLSQTLAVYEELAA